MRSMTGFGQCNFANQKYQISVEIKSLNNRFLNVNLRLPQELNTIEIPIRKLISERLMRGSIEINLTYRKNLPVLFEPNRPLIEGFLNVMAQIKQNYAIDGNIDLNTIARLPHAILPKMEKLDKELADSILEAIKMALDQLELMQEQEGKIIESNLNASLCKLEELAIEIEKLSETSVKDQFQIISKRVSELLKVELDSARLAQEIAYLAERADITEEVTRLKSHIHQFRQTLKQHRAIGKSLDFLTQELNRETNTILSKTPSIKIKEIALTLKNEIEKIREQVQNVE